jgi:hypothetical protein
MEFSIRRPSSLATNRPQSWILVSPGSAIAAKVRKLAERFEKAAVATIAPH